MKKVVMLLVVALVLSPLWSQMLIVIQVEGQKDKTISYEERDDNTLFMRVVDDSARFVENITKDMVKMKKQGKDVRVLDVEPLTRVDELSQKIVMVLDNSSSMHDAVNELLASVKIFLNNLGKASDVALVLFDENKQRVDISNITYDNKRLQLMVRDFSNDHQDLYEYSQKRIAVNDLTRSTYLHDAILCALDLLEEQPSQFQKSIVVLSDGKDTASKFSLEKVLQAASAKALNIYAIDFSRGRGEHLDLKAIVEQTQGELFKADRPDELVSLFDDISKEITTVYRVVYKMPTPPTASISFLGDTLDIQTKLIQDESPLLNYVFFDYDSDLLNEKYHLFNNPRDTDEFDETAIDNTLDKYYHLLNIIGSRLQATPEANLTLVGCNCNQEEEANALDLSKRRALAVRDYLTTIWQLDSSRISMKFRNLPEKPSSTRTPEGAAENRRVELLSDVPEILRPIKSIITEHQFTPPVGEFSVNVEAEDGLRDWRFKAFDGQKLLYSTEFTDFPGATFYWNWLDNSGRKNGSVSDLSYSVQVHDVDDQTFVTETQSIPVRAQTSQAITSTQQGGLVTEKYSLILFDFNSSTFGAKNAEMLAKVTSSYTVHDSAQVEIFGFCDTIGDEDYNQRLSARRAKGVYDALLRSRIPRADMTFLGYGETNPLFSNATPEGRFLNRTVQVYVSYPVQSQNREMIGYNEKN